MRDAVIVTCTLILLVGSFSSNPNTREAIECGRSRVEVEGIVGVRAAREGQLPYQVSLTMYGFHYCGGVIISGRTVVTAAHCVRKSNLTELYLRVGAGTHSQSRKAKWFKTYYDIAMLKVQEAFDLEGSKGYVAPICLPDPDPEQSSSLQGNIIVSGWGVTAEGGIPTPVMQMASIPMQNDSFCMSQYNHLCPSAVYDGKTMICAADLSGGKDTFQGDCGGPAAQMQNGTAVLVGIASFCTDCGHSNSVSFYTRVSHYLDWIRENSNS
ncbi:trypsin-1-like [Ornithodoros turicata]|uniref:trypsin-1-like n=1 Tax=Ornithodoros turicata TaxID=34597 RepID=UPI0031387F30